jgi:predicted PhzF superfamily epimerase YddE/YHI9
MTKAHILRVFTDSDGNFGDKASIVVDLGRQIPDAKRQALAKQIGTVETAFINDLANADISIMHTQGEIAFAGVPAIGTAWFLTKLRGKPITRMEGRGGSIMVSHTGELTWAQADLKSMPAWNFKKLGSAGSVEKIELGETGTWQHTTVWAWIDQDKGLVRARTFAADWDIPEVQGNGSGSMLLAEKLKSDIENKHGDGSVIFARSALNGYAEIGGRVVEEQSIEASFRR